MKLLRRTPPVLPPGRATTPTPETVAEHDFSRSAIITTGAFALSSFGALWLAIETLNYFNVVDLRSTGWLGLYLMAVHAVLLGIFGSYVRFVYRAAGELRKHLLAPVEGEVVLSDELVAVVARLHERGEHKAVVSIGTVLSRALWISGRYTQRIAIGGHLEDSAGRLGLAREQTAALIDDIGWTNAARGELDLAEESIRQGITMAEQSGDSFFAAKGYRHLAVIELTHRRRHDRGMEYLDRADATADAIADASAKEEMKAGITFNRAEALLEYGDCVQAKSVAQRAETMYTTAGDHARLAKVRTLLARIALRSGNLLVAKQGFRRAHQEAERLGRYDEIGKSLLGLAEVYIGEHKYDLARETADTACKALKEIGLKSELQRAEALLRELERSKTI